MAVQADVVALLADLEINPQAPIDQWRHFDGRPMTPEEASLAGRATRDDLDAVVQYHRAAAEYARGRADDFKRVEELVGPYFASMPPGTLMRDVANAMPVAEREELEEIMARLAPDGMIQVHRTATERES